jgi:hypothetical protein
MAALYLLSGWLLLTPVLRLLCSDACFGTCSVIGFVHIKNFSAPISAIFSTTSSD